MAEAHRAQPNRIIIRHVDVPNLSEGNVRAMNRFLFGISNTKYFQPDNKPRPEWQMHYGDNWTDAFLIAEKAAIAAGKGTIDGLLYTGIKEAEFAELRSNRHTTIIEIKEVVEEQVSKRMPAGMEEPFDMSCVLAIKDAQMRAESICTHDLIFVGKEDLNQHTSQRMDVWQKGYGLAGEARGKLYVYSVFEPEDKPLSLLRHDRSPSYEQELAVPQ